MYWTATARRREGNAATSPSIRVCTDAASSENGTSDLKNGKVDGDTLPWLEMLNFQGMGLEITYTGKIVSADQVDFTRQVADVATEKLVARRPK